MGEFEKKLQDAPNFPGERTIPRGPYKEYEKFIGKQVTVEYHKGDKIETETGELRFLSFSYLSVVLMTATEKTIIKNIITIRRARKK